MHNCSNRQATVSEAPITVLLEIGSFIVIEPASQLMKLENGCWNTDVEELTVPCHFFTAIIANGHRNVVFVAFLPSKSYEKPSDWQDLIAICIVANEKMYGAEAERPRV